LTAEDDIEDPFQHIGFEYGFVGFGFVGNYAENLRLVADSIA